MAEGFKSIADLKLVIDADNEKLTTTLEAASGLVQKFASNGTSGLSLFDKGVAGLAGGITNLQGRIQIMQSAWETGRAALGAFLESAKPLAQTLGAEKEFDALQTDILTLAETVGGAVPNAFSLAAGHASSFMERLGLLQAQMNTTSIASQSLASRVVGGFSDWAKLGSAAIADMTTPQGQQKAPVLEAGIDVLAKQLEKVNEQVRVLESGGSVGSTWLDRLIPNDMRLEQLRQTSREMEFQLGIKRQLLAIDKIGEAGIEVDDDKFAKYLLTLQRRAEDAKIKLDSFGKSAADVAAAAEKLRLERAVEDQGYKPSSSQRDAASSAIDEERKAATALAERQRAERAAEEERRIGTQRAQSLDKIMSGSEREIAQMRDKTEALVDNSRETARNAYEQRILAQAQAQGITLNDAQLATVRKLADSYAEAAEQTRYVNTAMQFTKEGGQIAARGLERAFKDWMNNTKTDTKELVRSMLADMAMLTFRRGVTEPLVGMLSQGVGSLVGSLFGGFREKGGDVKAGMAYVVGEKRPELFVPGVSGTVLPSVPTSVMPSAARAGGSITVNYSPRIDASGAYSESIAEIRRALAETQAAIPGRIIEVVRDSRERGIG